MSGAEITLEINEREAAEASRLINLRAGYLREALPVSTAFAAWFIARAAGSSTVQGPKKRKVVQQTAIVPDRRKGHEGQNAVVRLWALREFWNQRGDPPRGTIRKGGGILLPMFGVYNRAEANGHTARNIKQGRANPKGGLAKRVWTWGAAKALAKQTATTAAGTKGAPTFSVKVNADPHAPSTMLHSRLAYALQAMKREKVGTIVSRGLSAFRKDLERRAKVQIASGL